MKSSRIEPVRISAACAGANQWLRTMRSATGYRGLSVGRAGAAVRYAGPGFDLRYEALLDAQCALFAATGADALLLQIRSDIADLCSDQLSNGTFRNSWFDLNPCEGGMPHEPAAVAAACRSVRVLRGSGEPPPEGFEEMLELFVEKRLVRDLWNRLLRTFNDWLQSDFEHYSTASVAACIEVMDEYLMLKDTPQLRGYLREAADSLLALQFDSGTAKGALRIDNRREGGISLWATARALPALAAAVRVSGEDRFGAGLEIATQYVTGQLGQAASMRTEECAHGWSRGQLLLGETADAFDALARAGLGDRVDGDPFIEKLLEAQTAAGGFPTVGGLDPSTRHPDWRAVVPVTLWIAKIYALLARRHPAATTAFDSSSWRRDVRIGRRRAVLIEDSGQLRIECADGKLMYLWNKNSDWAEECHL